MRMLLAIALVFLTGSVRPAQNESDTESLIASIFSPPSSTQAPPVKPTTVFPELTTQAPPEQGGQVNPSTVFPKSTTQAQNQSDIESIIASIFSPSSSTHAPPEQGGQVKPSTVFAESTTQAPPEQCGQVKTSTVFPESTTQAQNQSDIESIIASIFSPPSSTQAPPEQGGQVKPSSVFPESTTQAQNPSDIESIIESIFSPPSSTQAPPEQGGQVKPSSVFPESTTQAQNPSDIESIIESIFSPPSSTQAPPEQGGQVKPSSVFPESKTQAQNQSDIEFIIDSIFSPPSSTQAPPEQGGQVKPSSVFPESTTQAQNQSDIESLIDSIFSPPSSTQAPPEQGGQVKPSSVFPESTTQAQNQSDIESIIDSIFSPPLSTQAPPEQGGQVKPSSVFPESTTQAPPEQGGQVKTSNANSHRAEKTKSSCGWRNPNGVGFQITGYDGGAALYGEFPWMVAILEIEYLIDDDPSSQELLVFRCGGSLINPSAVITAAHCVHRQRRQLRVRAGEWDTQTSREIYSSQNRNVTEVIVHRDFARASLVYDIALLILDKPMELAPNVGLACLPAAATGGLDPARVAGGVRCLATGWGKDSIGKEGRYQVILKRVELPVIPRYQCLSQLRARSRRRITELHRSFMCAGGERGHGICKGDGGAPLVCPIENQRNRYQQYGIAAWGLGCGEDAPSVYADVGQLRAWVDYHILAHGLDPATYTY